MGFQILGNKIQQMEPTSTVSGKSSVVTVTSEVEQDLEVLNSYLTACCFTLLDVNKDAFHMEIHKPDNQKIIKNFANERNQRSLIVYKIEPEGGAPEVVSEPVKGEETKADPKPDHGKELIEFSLEVGYKGTNTHAIAFLKREQIATIELLNHDLAKHVAAQLQVINIGYIGEDSTPFVITNTYILNSFTPLFQSFEEARYPKGGADEEEKKKSSGAMGLAKVHAKLAELSLALLQCQQNLDIPDVQLVVDNDVKMIVKKAKLENRKVQTSDFDDLMKNPDFVNGLTFRVNQWVKDIRKVTKLDRDPSTGSALQEVNFWLNLEKVLLHIKEQIEQPEIEATQQILKGAKRFYVVVSFEKDIELDPAITRVSGCNALMRNFPINSLIAAGNMEQIGKAIEEIFEKLKKSVKGLEFQYPTARFNPFLEAISRDLTAQMVKVLTGLKIMRMEYPEFMDLVTNKCQEAVFVEWEKRHKDFKEALRQQVQKKGERFTAANPAFEHELLKKRLTNLLAFRSTHFKFQDIIKKVIMNKDKEDEETGSAASKAMEQAYNMFLTFDVLDIKDVEMYESAKASYDNKIDKIENEITKELKDKLAAANNANEMFRVFTKFNALFVRPKIRAAIQEYQARLLDTVRKDIESLKEKFLSDKSASIAISKLRDIPAISGKIIWAKQIERKLGVYMERVRDLLGVNWDQYTEGKHLKDLSEQFKKHLNMQERVETWQKEVSAPTVVDIQSSSLVFDIVQKKDKLELIVNFDEKVTTLFKEVRNLTQLGYKITYAVKKKAETAKAIYPKAVSLQEILKTFYQTNLLIDDRVSKLVAKIKGEMQNILKDCLKHTWSITQELDKKIGILTEKVTNYEDAVINVKGKLDQMQQNLQELTTCPYTPEEFKKNLAAIQQSIDEFAFQEYSNVSLLAQEVDGKIEQILTKRLSDIVPKWIGEFTKFDESPHALITFSSVHEIKMLDQLIVLEPPIIEARAYWLREFHKLIEIVCGLPRIDSERYEKAKAVAEGSDNTYRSIMDKLANDVLLRAYLSIEGLVQEAHGYSKSWTKYQALWDIDSGKIFDRLGEDIDKWQKLLTEIKNERTTLDNSMTEKHFGALVIDYRAVQSKISNKYDSWHKDILKKFADTMLDGMRAYYQNVSVARTQLENQNLDITSTDVTVFITEIQEIKKKVEVWSVQMDRFKNGHKLLDKHRFQFPPDWLHVDQIEGEWSSLKQILSKKSKTMEEQIPTLQGKILAEEKAINEKQKDIEEE
eukprot:TRINITY_DN3930_c0_g2_i1.p1 TRINITY_DN3930_c0_g2~~TRINITY_DN3930_c0_g2_i1.p1  ORF type:complete len:1285 (-),score=333.29 TRINITY_DN3930_c0_g2_i1:418-4179(-)